MKVKLCEIAETKFSFPEKYKKNEIGKKAVWATAALLQNNNTIGEMQLDESLKPTDQLELLQGDIIIKRINPTYINFIGNAIHKSYVGNNLIIVRTKQGYSAKYIAFILNEIIGKFVKDSSSGSVVPAVNKLDLDNLIIDIPVALKVQEAIGELWYLGTEKKKLIQRLSELELLSNNIKLNQFIKRIGDTEL